VQSFNGLVVLQNYGESGVRHCKRHPVPENGHPFVC